MTNPIAYVGAGMSTTPPDIAEMMEGAAETFAAEGLFLRTGPGQVACEAFMRGARDPSKYAVYIPALTFGNLSTRDPGIYGPFEGNFDSAINYARKFHPAWHGMVGSVQWLMASASYQVLGPNLDDPAKFVLCWTPDGIGGDTTGQVLRLARAFDIPIFDLGVRDPVEISNEVWELIYALKGAVPA